MDEIQNNLKYILCELLNDETVQENIVNIVKKAKQQTEEFRQQDCEILEKEKNEMQYQKDKIYQQFQNYKKEYEPLQDIKDFWQGALQLEANQKSYLKKLCGFRNHKLFFFYFFFC